MQSLPWSRENASISSRITTVILVVDEYQINDNCFNEPFAVSSYKDCTDHMHGLAFETSIYYWQDQPGECTRTSNTGYHTTNRRPSILNPWLPWFEFKQRKWDHFQRLDDIPNESGISSLDRECIRESSKAEAISRVAHLIIPERTLYKFPIQYSHIILESINTFQRLENATWYPVIGPTFPSIRFNFSLATLYKR